MRKLKPGLLLLTAILTMGTISTAQADFVAYSVNPKGERHPLPSRINNIGVKHLINIEWGKHAGNKTRVGVLPVENNSNSSTVNITGPAGTATYSAGYGRGVPVQGIEAIIINVMLKTGRFRLVERKVLNKALQEQDLGASGRIAKPSAAKIGKVLGAQYLFQGVVTNYEAGVESKGGGLGGLLGGSAGAILGGLAVKSSKAVLGMNFRLINSETSEVVYSDQVEVAIEESGLTFGGFGATGGVALGGFMSEYTKTPIGQAVVSAANQGVFNLVKQVGSERASGSVIKSSKGKIYLNLGSASVSKNETLDLMQVGEQLIDPDTGISLGGEEEKIGSVKVTTVKEKYSIGKAVGIKSSKVKRGYKVVSQRKPEPLMYATNWAPPKEESSFFSGDSNSNASDNSEEAFQ